jgi:hypothetical protein
MMMCKQNEREKRRETMRGDFAKPTRSLTKNLQGQHRDGIVGPHTMAAF